MTVLSNVSVLLGVTEVPLTNVTGVLYSWGRRNVQDDFQGLTAVVTGFNSSAWSVTPQVGDLIQVRSQSGVYNIGGKVSDFSQTYGLKPSLDTWEITFDGPLITAGRIYGSITTTAGASTYAMGSSISTLTGGVIYPATLATYFGSTTSAQTLTDNVSDMVQLWLRTEGGYIVEYETTANLAGRYSGVLDPVIWSDNGPAYAFKYRTISFRSSAEQFAQQVIVQATGFADQTSGTGTYTTQMETINGSATEAATMAGYYKSMLDSASYLPTSLTTDSAILADNSFTVPALVGTPQTITFRGTTYQCVLMGASVSMDVDTISQTLFLGSAVNQSFFVLDSPTRGVLNTSKLGF